MLVKYSPYPFFNYTFYIRYFRMRSVMVDRPFFLKLQQKNDVKHNKNIL